MSRRLREVKLRVAGGRERRAWDVEVVADEYGDVHLAAGWREFARANGLNLGQLLFFRYDGVALVTVTVLEGRPSPDQHEEEEETVLEGRHEEEEEEEEEAEEEEAEEEEEAAEEEEAEDDDDEEWDGTGTLRSLTTFPFGLSSLAINRVHIRVFDLKQKGTLRHQCRRRRALEGASAVVARRRRAPATRPRRSSA
jgi:hypothetical protein